MDSWTHVGRLWTNGEPFLAVDAVLRGSWHGFSDDEFGELVEVAQEQSTIAVGAGRAAVVGADGVVRDDSWMEVFRGDDGTIAVLQASGDDYQQVLSAALRYPDTEDAGGDVFEVPSGELALFSAAFDGDGEHSVSLVPPRPGPVPRDHGPPTPGVDPGLLLPSGHPRYRVKVRWYTEIDDEGCFARWLLIPERPA